MRSLISYKTFLILLLIEGFVAFVLAEGHDPLIVELPNGKIRGRLNADHYSYESIPYAEPPVGELRFEAPKPYKRVWLDVFDATKPPVRCIQWDQFTEGVNKLIGVEDCLTVNVYKPKNESRASFPVIVVIHGGAYMFGAVADYGPEFLLRRGNVIVVEISYRLGPLGFISAEDKDLPGNYGLKDQRLALQWIKSNIARFGGEPENILVMGFSSGGASVHYHLLQPEFKKIAKVAVSFSGTALNSWSLVQKSRDRAFEMGRLLHCESVTDSLSLKDCLKMKTAEDIVEAVQNFLVFDYIPAVTFGPVIEPVDAKEAFLTQSPIDIISSGNFAQIPWLVSYTVDDGGYNAALLLKRQPPYNNQLIEELNESWHHWVPYFFYTPIEIAVDYSNYLKHRYLQDNSFSLDNYPLVQKIFTDELFKNGAEQAVELHRKYGSSPIYAYLYDNPADFGVGQVLANRDDIKFGTAHADDFSLIIKYPTRTKPLREDERIISDKLITMLEDFVQSDSGKLSFGNCQFVNNVGEEQLQLMSITQSTCRNENLVCFP